jgi:hypothetical protein
MRIRNRLAKLERRDVLGGPEDGVAPVKEPDELQRFGSPGPDTFIKRV